ncbi:MAG: NAD(P) transhydrogenase subunit alpha [Opitutales bacterium]|nr:NAD(P) transhydrogenase subunit alpha [Opitutales bacterium]
MRLVVLKELDNEARVALTPAVAAKLVGLGVETSVEAGLGAAADYPDAAYADAGALVGGDRGDLLARADIVWRVRKPPPGEVDRMKRGAVHVSFFDPFLEKDMLRAFAEAGISAVSMEMMPRTTLAQKMDALSSQANLAGYAAVIKAAALSRGILPMMMTPAGTLSPARVFVIGVGVAGLQAIATAKRLGARVEAFDTRPVVEEQVRSLGAKFVKVDLGETGETEDGYARELTPAQVEQQREGMAKVCAQSDVVITTAKLFGRPAPVLVTAAMTARMKPGSIVVDLAAGAGGNVEGVKPGETVVTENGVRIVGTIALEATVARDSSAMYAANLYALFEHFWSAEEKRFALRLDDEILRGCLLTHGGEVVHPKFRKES